MPRNYLSTVETNRKPTQLKEATYKPIIILYNKKARRKQDEICGHERVGGVSSRPDLLHLAKGQLTSRIPEQAFVHGCNRYCELCDLQRGAGGQRPDSQPARRTGQG